ncbi:hypothetical protein O3P69_001606 [Scylla paramamosain]|uniref:Uncharacterized protein n=1 Tax=Scylla paramamosain TaxID=85552 RepID=A0AAW0UYD5_SCYPA
MFFGPQAVVLKLKSSKGIGRGWWYVVATVFLTSWLLHSDDLPCLAQVVLPCSHSSVLDLRAEVGTLYTTEWLDLTCMHLLPLYRYPHY